MPENKPNILFILPEYYPHSGGGISTYYIHYIRALKPHCNKIKVIIGSGYTHEDTNLTFEGIEIEFLKPKLFNKYLSKFKKFDVFPEYQKNIAAAWAMYEQSNQGIGYDIIECVDFGHGYIPWVLKKDKIVVTRLHGSSGQIELNEANCNTKLIGDLNRLTELILLPKCDQLLTYSQNNQAYWNKNLPNKEVAFIYPTFEVSIEQKEGKIEKSLFALVCGRVQQWKGPDVLCKAFSVINEAIPLISWIGRDTFYNENSTKTQHLTEVYPAIWNKRIIHSASLENQKMLSLQAETKFGIVPSTWDMFNFTCVEFLSQGVPVICSEYAGCSSLITNGVNGFKYKDNNPEELADCLQKANRLTENEYKLMCIAALESIKANLSASNTIYLNLSMYGNLKNSLIEFNSDLFLNEIFEPSDEHYSFDTILDRQPLKQILKYITKRIKSKLKF